MAPFPSHGPTWKQTLSRILRGLRRIRLLRVKDLAARMGMRPRSYEYFESGRARPNLERIHRFAQEANADPHGIWAAMMIGSPNFALRTADNRLMSAFLIALEEFDQAAGDDIALLETGAIVAAFTASFAVLIEESRQKAGLRDAYSAGRPKPDDAPT